MYTIHDCTDEDIGVTNIEGRYIILKEEFFLPQYRTEEYQLVKAIGGFGCNPKVIMGNAIYVEEQTKNNPEKYRIDRCNRDILGIAKDSVVAAHQEKYNM